MDKTNATIYSKIQADFVKRYFLDALIFRKSIAIKPRKATKPRTMQKGINLGYCFVTEEPSSAIAMTIPDKFKRHSIPRLKREAFANKKKGRII